MKKVHYKILENIQLIANQYTVNRLIQYKTVVIVKITIDIELYLKTDFGMGRFCNFCIDSDPNKVFIKHEIVSVA